MPPVHTGPEEDTRASAIGLLELDPAMNRLMSPEQRLAAAQLSLPVHQADERAEIRAWLTQQGAFAALVVAGLLIRSITVRNQAALRLLLPGDLLVAAAQGDLTPLVESGVQATPGSRLALLHAGVVQHAPQLTTALLARLALQSERIAAQLAIAHMSRVEDRVLALMQLLEVRCGSVHDNGTLIPVRLTHEQLGGLVGARRPTVSIALRGLANQGLLTKHPSGWLLHPSAAASRGPLPADQTATS